MKKLNTIIIGFGNQTKKEHFSALINSDLYSLVAIIDKQFTNLDEHKEMIEKNNVLLCDNLEDFKSKNTAKIDVAIISLPHDQYLDAIIFCAKNKIHILKEKPFARNREEAQLIYDIVKENKIKLMTSFQRRFHPIFQSFKFMISQLGEIKSVNVQYTLSSKTPNSGWRGDMQLAGGGVMMDMGYHIIDLLIWYFDPIKIIDKDLNIVRKENYNTDDTSYITFEVNNIKGIVFISCVFPIKNEQMVVVGSRGSAILKKDRIERYNTNNELVEYLEGDGSWRQAMQKQLEYFYDIIINDYDEYLSNPEFQLNNHVKIMDTIYENTK